MMTPEELRVSLAIARQDAANQFELKNKYRKVAVNANAHFWYAVVTSFILGAIVGAIVKALS